MAKKMTGGKRQVKPAVRSIRRTVTVFIKTVVHHLVEEKCRDRIIELTGVDLGYDVVPSVLFKRCYRRALASFYFESEDATTSARLMEDLAYWTLLDLPDLVDKEFAAPGLDRLFCGHIARSYEEAAAENFTLKLDLVSQSAS